MLINWIADYLMLKFRFGSKNLAINLCRLNFEKPKLMVCKLMRMDFPNRDLVIGGLLAVDDCKLP